MPTSTAEKWFDAHLKASHDMGVFILRNLLLLNGGGIVLLLSLLGSVSADGAFHVSVSSLKISASFFLIGIVSALLAAILAYAVSLFANSESGQTNIPGIKHTLVEPGYFVFGGSSLLAFIAAVVFVINGIS